MALPRNLHSFGIGGLGALGTKLSLPKPDANGNCPSGFTKKMLMPAGKGQPAVWGCVMTQARTDPAASSIQPMEAVRALFAPLGAPDAKPVGTRADAAGVAATAAWLTPLVIAGVAGTALLFVLRRR